MCHHPEPAVLLQSYEINEWTFLEINSEGTNKDLNNKIEYLNNL